MFSIKITIIYFISLNIIVKVQALDPLPVVENNNLAITETVIRNTVNNLVALFKIQGIKKDPLIKQYTKIHNFFVSITLKDCENLNKIARLSTVNNIDNNTQNYITQINEVLNEGDKTDDVTIYIERFIKKLRYLKETYVSKRDTVINKRVLKFLEDNGKSITNATADNVMSNKTDESEDKHLLDDNEFWQSSGRRIYKGIRTNIKQFPFMASIHIFSAFQCAGSIIKDDLVITSSSCLQIAWNNRFFRENPSFLSVRVGSDMYQSSGDDIPVLEIYFHPQYNPDTLAHNLAIMRLGRLLKFRKNRKRVKKIDFDRNPFPLTSNTMITVIGWGAKDTTNKVYDVYKNKLSYSDLYFYPLGECQDHYSKEYVTNKHFCAGFFSKGSGACSHDAGGPGITDSKLIGVISFGSPVCGATDAPTVFTKLGFYADWIEKIMEQASLTISVPTRPRIVKSPQHVYPTIPTTTKLVIEPIDFTNVHLIDILRAKTEDGFKDFVSTVFSNEENEDNSDTYDMNSKETRSFNLKGKNTTQKDLITEKVTEEWFIQGTTPRISTSEATTYVKDRREVFNTWLSEEVTLKPATILLEEEQKPLDLFNEIVNKEVAVEAVTPKSGIIKNRTNEENSLLDDIMVVLDNLDIDQILSNVAVKHNINNQIKDVPLQQSDLASITSDNRMETKQIQQPASDFLLELEDDDDVDDDDGDDDDDDGDDDDDDGGGGSREEGRGMAIQLEPFRDLTFRERSNNTKTQYKQKN